jgi:hypothetical protein
MVPDLEIQEAQEGKFDHQFEKDKCSFRPQILIAFEPVPLTIRAILSGTPKLLPGGT